MISGISYSESCQTSKMEFFLEIVNDSKLRCSEAVVWRCSVKKVFLEISQNS